AQRLPEDDRGVLHRVVDVDVDVTLSADGEVEQGVAAKLVEHVVVERDTGGHVHPPGAGEIELDDHLAFLGFPLDSSAPRSPVTHNASTSRNAARNAVISSNVPIETRSQPSGPVSRMSTPRSSSPFQTACRSSKRPKRTKLASESIASRPRPRSQLTVWSRRARSSSTRASSSSACRRAASATAWLTADRWYGNRTIRKASTTAGSAAR